MLIVIPARHASVRLPGKPLLAETGKPLIQHVYEAAARVRGATVLVATDDARIERAVLGFGGAAVMTDPGHSTGSARVAEAAAGTPARIIVNVQGDEPELEPAAIETLIETHERAQASARPAFASTLVSAFPQDADPDDPDTVKAVLSEPDEDGLRSALYFSRSRLPFPRGEGAAPLLHIGSYAFSAETLQAFARLPRTPLERTESLEQLRILEHGHRIAAAIVPPAAPGIDTPADYARFVARQRR
ncbi:3-deoxy-manno-octulosonate cytidylyltransferase [Parvularcula oceani]|uniref:3-deoxy-manno-octulosonate cytidylyltransferase n=1 Tax=Parvularcula oceani TaxID=1247963 RepID=UPI001EE1A228|nr:3-deoxy-manno-octulosonate cytidylyltransferase [Parvularcula oceani]